MLRSADFLKSFSVSLMALAALAVLPLQAEAATFNWQEAIARISAERHRAEVCAQEIRRYGDEAAIDAARALYDSAAAELDTVLQGMLAALTDDEAPPAFTNLEAALKRSLDAREALCDRAWDVMPGVRGGEKAATTDLGTDFKGSLSDAMTGLYDQAQEQDELTRRTVRTQLEGVSPRAFEAATAGIELVEVLGLDSGDGPDAFTRVEVYFGTDRVNEGTADEPVFLAGRAHELQLGKVQVTVDALDTIDATALGTDFFGLNHSDYADHPVLLNDIGLLMKTGLRPPDERLIALRPVDGASGRYWVYPHF